jgi:hypothetical protein
LKPKNEAGSMANGFSCVWVQTKKISFHYNIPRLHDGYGREARETGEVRLKTASKQRNPERFDRVFICSRLVCMKTKLSLYSKDKSIRRL